MAQTDRYLRYDEKQEKFVVVATERHLNSDHNARQEQYSLEVQAAKLNLEIRHVEAMERIADALSDGKNEESPNVRYRPLYHGTEAREKSQIRENDRRRKYDHDS